MARAAKTGPWKAVVDELQERGISFTSGLTDEEVVSVERRYDFHFPPDLRQFLQTALPLGSGFPNWRTHDEAAMREWLRIPLDGIQFDIEHNGFWLNEWGPRPAHLPDAFQVASDLIEAAPTLIPIYTHRMMPDEPRKTGNPVFSVHQTDIIYYGHDLLDYFHREFHVARWWTRLSEPRPIRFWDLERFQMRWSDGGCAFDNSGGVLPEAPAKEAPGKNP